MFQSDVAVIGAGPTGSLSANYLARKGLSVTVIEQRETIGAPDHCAGLLSLSGLDLFHLRDLPKKIIQNDTVQGAIFHSPLGKSFKIKRSEPQAIVVDRELFDQYLAERAEKQGAKILRGYQVTKAKYNIEKQKIHLTLRKRKKERGHQKTNSSLEATAGIIAEGRRAALTKAIGLPIVNRKYKLPAMQMLVSSVKGLEPNLVEIFASNIVAPGFFAWIIPVNETTAKVGLASSVGGAAKRLRYFIEKYPPSSKRFSEAKIEKKYGGEVLVGGPVKQAYSDGFVAVGDAVGQTKATTGGGVITGGVAALYAAKVIAKAVEEKNVEARNLRRYNRLCKQNLYGQLAVMSLFRKLVNLLSDKAFEKAFETVVENNLIELLEEKGDIDSQATILGSLMKHPAVIKLAFRILPSLQLPRRKY